MKSCFLFLISVFLFSCISLKEVDTSNEIDFNGNNCSNFQETYFDIADSALNYSIADFLIPGYQAKFNRFKHLDTIFCKLDLLSKHKLSLQLFRDKTLEFEGELKVKYKGGYFYIKPRIFHTSTVGLYDMPIIQKVRIARSLDGKLLLDAILDWKDRRIKVPGNSRVITYQLIYNNK